MVEYPDIYFTGDGAKIDEEGYYWLLGRGDDVINVSAHRISTMEVESALVDNANVAEAACIGRTHDIKGQAIVAFVTIKNQVTGSDSLITELKQHVATKIGPWPAPTTFFCCGTAQNQKWQNNAAITQRRCRRPSPW
ncbi:MAG: hypothetical protein Ct9H300mP27_05560 [Chloroflexota bacterium]|nr:MAG: hypothetical protein Ct9H300mP27_05560 [Chloroflexota bacterium]